MNKPDMSKMNHVVRTNSGFSGTWGRGFNFFHALKNAGVRSPEKTAFTYYIFRNDNWDILDTGTVTWEEDTLIFLQEYDPDLKGQETNSRHYLDHYLGEIKAKEDTIFNLQKSL